MWLLNPASTGLTASVLILLESFHYLVKKTGMKGLWRERPRHTLWGTWHEWGHLRWCSPSNPQVTAAVGATPDKNPKEPLQLSPGHSQPRETVSKWKIGMAYATVITGSMETLLGYGIGNSTSWGDPKRGSHSGSALEAVILNSLGLRSLIFIDLENEDYTPALCGYTGRKGHTACGSSWSTLWHGSYFIHMTTGQPSCQSDETEHLVRS